jgi:hypothetical protein
MGISGSFFDDEEEEEEEEEDGRSGGRGRPSPIRPDVRVRVCDVSCSLSLLAADVGSR